MKATKILSLIFGESAERNFGRQLMDELIKPKPHEQTCVDLVARGAEMNLTDNKEGTALQVSQYTALHLSVVHGFTRLTAAMINHGADINAVDNEGNSAVHIAIQKGDLRVLNEILEGVPDINIVNNNGDTPMLLAVKQKNTDAVGILLKNGARTDIADAAGNFPLDLMAAAENKKMPATHRVAHSGTGQEIKLPARPRSDLRKGT